MQVYLDGQLVDGADEAQCLSGLRTELRTQRRVPQRLLVDGQDLSTEALAALDGCGAQRVELETLALGDAAVNGYAEAARFLPKVAQTLERSSDRLSLGQVSESMDDFARVCQGVSWFFDLVGALDKLLGEGHGGGWEKDAVELKTLLLETEEAIRQQDWVLVSDQLRYEWSPRLQAWCARLPQAEAQAAALLLAKS
jgi:hypothetical protein